MKQWWAALVLSLLVAPLNSIMVRDAPGYILPSNKTWREAIKIVPEDHTIQLLAIDGDDSVWAQASNVLYPLPPTEDYAVEMPSPADRALVADFFKQVDIDKESITTTQQEHRAKLLQERNRQRKSEGKPPLAEEVQPQNAYCSAAWAVSLTQVNLIIFDQS